MPTLPVTALGTRTASSGTTLTGSEPVLQIIASASDSSYVHAGTNNATGSYTADFELGNMPSDFGNMDTAAIRLRYLRASGTAVNTWDSLQARVFQSDGTTALSNAVTIASNITTTTATNSSAITLTGLNTSAGKSVWDGALVRITFNITRSMGGDTLERRVTAAELTGTYTEGLPEITGSMASTESGADTLAASGTVTDPLVTGSLTATESGADAFASSGTVVVTGTLEVTESGVDLLTASGTVVVVGVLVVTESGADVFAALGEVVIVGLMGAVESGSDVFEGVGAVADPSVTGTMIAVENGVDIFDAGGDVTGTGAEETFFLVAHVRRRRR